jgi:hypothetical protein
LEDLARRILDAEMESRKASALAAVVSPLAAPSAPVATEALERLVTEWRSCADQMERLSQDLAAAQGETTELATRIRERAAVEVCPTCGAPIDAERLLAGAPGLGGHQHG